MKYKKSIISILSLVGFIGAVLVALPEAIRYFAEKELQKQGLEQVRIKDIDFNPFRGELVIKEIQIQLAEDMVFSLHKIRLEKDWKPLFDKHILINQLSIIGAEIVIEKTKSGFVAAGFKAKEKTTPQPASPPSEWKVGIQDLQLKNTTIIYKSPDLNQTFWIKSAKLSDLYSWKPKQAGHLLLDIEADDGIIKANLDLWLFTPDKKIMGRIAAENVLLEPYQKIAQLAQLTGLVQFKLDEEIKIKADNSIQIKQKGQIEVTTFALALKNLKNTTKKIAWDGDLQLNLTPQEKKIQWEGKLNINNEKLHLIPQKMRMRSHHLALSGKGNLILNQQIALDFKGQLDDHRTAFSNTDIKIKPFDTHWKGNIALGLHNKQLTLKTQSQNFAIKKVALHLNQPSLQLSPLTLNWQGRFNLKQNKGLNLDWKGQLGLYHLDLKLADLATQTKKFTYQGSGKYQKHRNQLIQIKGKTKANQLTFKNKQAQLSPLDLTWNGDINLDLQKMKKIDWKGVLTLDHLGLTLPEQTIAVDNQKFNYQGSGKLKFGEVLVYLIQGNVHSNDLKIKTAQEKITLTEFKGQKLAIAEDLKISAKQLTLNALELHQKKLQLAKINKIIATNLILAGIEQAQLSKLTFVGLDTLKLKYQPSLLKSKQLTLQDLKWQKSRLTLKRIYGKKLIANIQLNSKGKIPALAALSPQSKPVKKAKKPKKTKASKKASPIIVKINKISLDKASKVMFKDKSVSPHFKTALAFSKFEIRHLNTQAKKMSTKVDIQGRINKYAPLQVKGQFGLAHQQLNMEMKTTIKGMELSILSPYTKNSIGYILQKGQLNANIQAKITQGEMDILNKLKLSKVEVKAFEGAKNKLSVPLETGIGMLKDKKGIIELDLPITGNIKDPKFDIGGVINIALGKAMKAAALSAVALAVQPYGAILVASKMIGEKAFSAKLEAIEFKAGTTEPTKDPTDYVAKLAKMLDNRPAMQLTICGVATAQDRVALIAIEKAKIPAPTKPEKTDEKAEAKDKTVQPPPPIHIPDEQLKDIANTRTEFIKNQFFNQYQIESDRLIGCHPAIEEDKEAKPRVDIGL